MPTDRSSIYSQGVNFGNLVSSGVDPRTGQYTNTITLFRVPAETRNCPPFELSLTFNSMNTRDIGFGAGWSLNLSTFQHRESKILSLSNGEQYKITTSGGELKIKDQKLRSCFFKRQGDLYHVIHKSGLIEILSNQEDAFNICVPIELRIANGRSLKLVWSGRGDLLRLLKVQQSSQDLLHIDYDDLYVNIVRHPQTEEESTLTARKRNGLLDRLYQPLKNSRPMRLTYDKIGSFNCLTTVTSFSGLVETIKYDSTGHQLPTGAPYYTLPYVKMHIADPGNNQPPIKTHYEYSRNNFLGYGGVLRWDDNEDNLYLARDDYLYTTSVTVEGGQQTKNTYNKFHLLVHSWATQGGTKEVEQTLTYYGSASNTFREQPAQYQLPKSVATTYRDTAFTEGHSRTETHSYEFDEWGNPTVETDIDGTRTERSYYPSDGQDDLTWGEKLCPPDPYGFTKYLKVVTVIPSSESLAFGHTRSVHYSYLSMPAAASADNHISMIAVKESQSFVDGVRMSTTEYAYVNKPESMDHGRLQRQTTTLHDEFITTRNWKYDYPTPFQMKQTSREETYDGFVTEAEMVNSISTGLKLASRDDATRENKFEYDKLGRLVKATTAPGTAYEAVQSTVFINPEGEDGSLLVTSDSKGVKTRHVLDGMERIVRLETEDCDEKEILGTSASTRAYRVTQECRYDRVGRLIRVDDIDWLRQSGHEPQEQRFTQTFEYDEWGEVSRTTNSGGLVSLTETDPIMQIKMESVEGEGSVRTCSNTQGLPIKMELLNRDGIVYSSTHYIYDGLNRLIEEVDDTGRTTRHSYDSFDRLTDIRRVGDRSIHIQYAAESSEDTPTAISVNGDVLGTQSYDGLTRVTCQTAGSRTTIWQYQGNSSVASQTVTPSGETQHMDYNPILNDAMIMWKNKDDVERFEHDPQTAEILRLEGPNSTKKLKYSPSGLLKCEEYVVGKSEPFVAEAVHSLAGKIQSYTDVMGQDHQFHYDKCGRLQELIRGHVRVSLIHDKEDRITESYVRDKEQMHGWTTRQLYDEFGREVERSISNNTETMFSLTQEYDTHDLCTKRTLRDKEGQVIRNEMFDYDGNDRLTKYHCEGTKKPVEEENREIRIQRFCFDVYDNLTNVTTTYSDGSTSERRYIYDGKDPTLLRRIINTNADDQSEIKLAYDENGCLTRDELGRELQYDIHNRLILVRDGRGKILSEYRYDAGGALVCQEAQGKKAYFHYREGALTSITGDTGEHTFLHDGTTYWGQVERKDGKTQTRLWALDAQDSVLAWFETQAPDKIAYQTYTPYGYSDSSGPPIGFNGEWKDPVTGFYHLGNGNRVYSPTLMRFIAPDAWTPFISGEINPYTYCLGDPVNNTDPTGHMTTGGREALVMGVGLGLGILVGVLTAGASTAVSVGAAIVTGAVYDVATGHGENIGTDLLLGIAGGIGGELVLRGLAAGFKSLSHTVDGILDAGYKLRNAGGPRRLPSEHPMPSASGIVRSGHPKAPGLQTEALQRAGGRKLPPTHAKPQVRKGLGESVVLQSTRYSQDTISSHFTNGTPVTDQVLALRRLLRAKPKKAQRTIYRFPRIEVAQHELSNGHLATFSYSNRRLDTFKRAFPGRHRRIYIPARGLSPQDVRRQRGKLTTIDEGLEIRRRNKN